MHKVPICFYIAGNCCDNDFFSAYHHLSRFSYGLLCTLISHMFLAIKALICSSQESNYICVLLLASVNHMYILFLLLCCLCLQNYVLSLSVNYLLLLYQMGKFVLPVLESERSTIEMDIDI
jgi:hypothetical protein